MLNCNKSSKPNSLSGGDTFCSQKELVLEHLQGGNTITRLEAEEQFNCLSLSQRISELRQEGYNIASKPVKTGTGKRIAEYKLL